MKEMKFYVHDAVYETIEREARKQRTTNATLASQILATYHKEQERLPEGVLNAGRDQLVDFLRQVPSLRNFRRSAVDFRSWWVSFEIDLSLPLAWKVIRALALNLNNHSANMWLATVFKPIPDKRPDQPTCWRIESTDPLLDPAEVVQWLEMKLPTPLNDVDAWNEGN
jgi:hypothetical protein